MPKITDWEKIVDNKKWTAWVNEVRKLRVVVMRGALGWMVHYEKNVGAIDSNQALIRGNT